MNKTIENKLLHFCTDGSIYEDFARSRTQKVSRLRRVVRLCFYAHCAAAILAIILAAILRAGLGIIPVIISELFICALAFFSVGEMRISKLLLIALDGFFAVVMFSAGWLEDKGAFTAVGVVSVLSTLAAFASYAAWTFRVFLEGYSPFMLKREHYMLIPSLGDTPDSENREEKPAEPEPVLPPPKSEVRILAETLKEILNPKPIPEPEPESQTQQTQQMPQTEEKIQ